MSVDWYVNRWYNAQRRQVDANQGATQLLFDPWNEKQQHYDIILTAQDLYTHDTNFVVGVAQPRRGTIENSSSEDKQFPFFRPATPSQTPSARTSAGPHTSGLFPKTVLVFLLHSRRRKCCRLFCSHPPLSLSLRLHLSFR